LYYINVFADAPVDVHFYKTFWGLQRYFEKPATAQSIDKWHDLMKRADAVLTTFASHNLVDKQRESEKEHSRGHRSTRSSRRHAHKESSSADVTMADTAQTSATLTTAHFAKFLTSVKLINLQVNE